MCRKTFDLPSSPKQARVHVAVADKYMLYVNGGYVGRGPCRSASPDWMCFDTHDLSARLKPGRNVIAVLAFYYGCPNNFSHDQRAGLFVQLEAALDDGCLMVIGSDRTWKMQPASGWRNDVESISVHQGIHTEVYEAGRDSEDWMKPDYDDSTWQDAFVTSVAQQWVNLENKASWSYLEPRTTPLLREREVRPRRVVFVGETFANSQPSLKDTQVPERLDAEEHRTLSACTAEGIDGWMGIGADALLCSNRGHDPVVILDYGQPLMAMPKITFDAPKGIVVEMTYSDHLANGRVPAQPNGNAMRYGDRYVAREGLQTWQPFEIKTATRYLQIVFRTGDLPVHVRSVNLISHEYPAEQRGSFACSDDTLTSLWKTVVNTAYLHLEDTFVFDPVRERTVYALMGEAEQQHLAYYAAFGDIAATDYNFRYTIRRQTTCGMIPFFLGWENPAGFPFSFRRLPLTSGTTMSQALNTYCLFYPQAVLNRHRYFGKPGFLEEQYPALLSLTRWFEQMSDHETGLLDNVPPIVFLDWPTFNKWTKATPDASGANFGLNALYARLLDDMAEIALALGQKNDAKQWQTRAAAVRECLRRTHWDAKRGLYVDIVLEGKPLDLFSELINGMALLYDIATPQQIPQIVRELIDPKPDVTRVSPLYFYYVMEGLIKAGADQYVIRHLSESYHPLIASSDFPTLCEYWVGKGLDHPGMESGIHGGGSGVASTLTSHVLGIKPVKPGFAEVVFDPHPGDLQWAKGVVPTPHGDIRVEWKREDNGAILPKIEIPAGVKLIDR